LLVAASSGSVHRDHIVGEADWHLPVSSPRVANRCAANLGHAL
jgi:hypothetical protein